MLKNLLALTLGILLWPSWGSSQAVEATLLSQWHDESLPATTAYDGRYNDVWGVTINGREIAIIGSTMGVHFFDVTDPSNLVELTSAFVAGRAQGRQIIHRDFHDYGGYLYLVADEGSASTLQVIDLTDLPNSTTLVYDSNEHFRTAHNVFIDEDNARLYAFGADYGAKGVAVYSLEDPERPVELASYPADGNVPYAHDGYVRDNIAYLNCGSFDGFLIYDLTDPKNPQLIESMTSYHHQGFNLSGWLDEVGRYYFMADETWGTDLKVIDVCEEENLEVSKTFDTGSNISTSIPLNLIVKCNLLYVSYYHEGLQVFDVSDPLNPERIAFYDTFDGPDEATYQGAWGVYPLFESGTILISDMNNGLFVFEALPRDCEAYQAEPCNADTMVTSTQPVFADDGQIQLSPQPVRDELQIQIEFPELESAVHLEWYDVRGRLLTTEPARLLRGANTLRSRAPASWAPGLYLLRIRGTGINAVRKVMVE